jgi:hypothetical protein
MENKPGFDVFDLKGIDKKLNNLMDFDDFEKGWNAKKQKSTRRTDVGLDILEEKMSKDEFLAMIGKKKKTKKGKKNKKCSSCGN